MTAFGMILTKQDEVINFFGRSLKWQKKSYMAKMPEKNY